MTSDTPKTDAVVWPYIYCEEIKPEEVDALLSHARAQERLISELVGALEAYQNAAFLFHSTNIAPDSKFPALRGCFNRAVPVLQKAKYGVEEKARSEQEAQ